MITREALHRQLKTRLQLPDYYGENLDALWDCLQYLALPLTLQWLDFSVAKLHLNEYAEKTLQTLLEAQEAIPGFTIEVIA